MYNNIFFIIFIIVLFGQTNYGRGGYENIDNKVYVIVANRLTLSDIEKNA